MPNIGPIRMQVAGDVYRHGARILAFVWEGPSTAGDTAEIADPVSGARLWRGRANDVQNYVGLNAGFEGVHAPNGFMLKQISSGDVYVYLREN